MNLFGFDLPTMTEITKEIVEVIKTNQFAQGGMLISFLVALPNYIIPYFKTLWGRIRRLLVYTLTIEEKEDLFMYFEMWLAKNHKTKYRNVEAVLKLDSKVSWNYDPISGEDLDVFDESVHFKQFQDLFYIRRGFNIIKVFKGRDRLENASNMENLHHSSFTISGIFCKRLVNKMIIEAHENAKELMAKKRKTSIMVYTSDTYGDWNKESVVEPKAMDSIIFNGKEKLLKDINQFIVDKDLYKQREILYKRGYLFYGNAGTGKTSFTMSLAKELKRDLYFLQLKEIKDQGVRTAFRNLKPNSILVIEDIDAVFSSRDDADDIKFSFSTLLNCLDGVFSTENVIVVFTTNHIEKLDSALIRKGRIDYKCEFESPNKEYVKKYIDRFYQIDSDFILDYKENLPMVDVQECCVSNPNNYKEAIKQLLLTSIATQKD